MLWHWLLSSLSLSLPILIFLQTKAQSRRWSSCPQTVPWTRIWSWRSWKCLRSGLPSFLFPTHTSHTSKPCGPVAAVCQVGVGWGWRMGRGEGVGELEERLAMAQRAKADRVVYTIVSLLDIWWSRLLEWRELHWYLTASLLNTRISSPKLVYLNGSCPVGDQGLGWVLGLYNLHLHLEFSIAAYDNTPATVFATVESMQLSTNSLEGFNRHSSQRAWNTKTNLRSKRSWLIMWSEGLPCPGWFSNLPCLFVLFQTGAAVTNLRISSKKVSYSNQPVAEGLLHFI